MNYLFVAGFLFFLACAETGVKQAAEPYRRERAAWRGDETRKECLRAIRQARQDAGNGTYRMYVFGSDIKDERFGRFLREYMQGRYGIELILSGPEDRERNRCYSNEMDKIILNTFGPDILAVAEGEAREAFESRK